MQCQKGMFLIVNKVMVLYYFGVAYHGNLLVWVNSHSGKQESVSQYKFNFINY